MKHAHRGTSLFQVWIARFSRWVPRRWSDMPPRAQAVEPFDARLWRRDEAHQIVEGFNREMLAAHDHLWAIAVPVQIRIDGEPQRGTTFAAATLAKCSPIKRSTRAGDGRVLTKGFSNRPNVRDTR